MYDIIMKFDRCTVGVLFESNNRHTVGFRHKQLQKLKSFGKPR